ncbi:MAG: hypothetical protein IPO26_16430 [Saprospiraceae bacterium]|nr:hypothetical protein [Saprospiraceae bacterium]
MKEENKILTNNNQELTMRVEEEIKAKENVITEKNALTAEKENLSKSNAALGTKVDMANAIKINFMEVKGFEIKKMANLRSVAKQKTCKC